VKLVLVSNWKEALKFFSVQAMLVAGVLTASWDYIPESLRQLAPPQLGKTLVEATLVLGILGRLVDQELTLWAKFKASITDKI
jgi:hypothetical protein